MPAGEKKRGAGAPQTRRGPRAAVGKAPPDVLDRRRLIVAANRGPVSFLADPSGEPVVSRGLGGLVSVLGELFRNRHGTWIAAAQSDEEYRLAAEGRAVEVELDGVPYAVRYVAPDREAYQQYYNVMANPTLWFVQHYLWDLAWHPDITANEYQAWQQYLEVDRLFAEAVLDEIGGEGDRCLVMLHDYHLYCVAPLVRASAPEAFLHHFVHIPWPQSDYWRVLPQAMRSAIFEGLLASDVVAFHTAHYAENFLQGCADVLDLPVDFRRSTVAVGDREVWVRSYPVSIDPETLRRAMRSDRVVGEERQLVAQRPEHLLLRVDRLDPSKNVIRGFRAFDLFLQRHPEFARRVTFLALLQPSREDVEEYVVYRERVMRAAEEVNSRHGRGDWWPVDVRVQDNFAATLAAYRHYDALYVNAIFDGMNLVAKEGAICNQRDGVLILSEHTGAFAELGAFAIGVNPFDLEDQAEAIHRALTMSAAERRTRFVGLHDVVEHNTVERWIGAQLADVAAKVAAAAKATQAGAAGSVRSG
jgi:trehalose 6-phosphate synthase